MRKFLLKIKQIRETKMYSQDYMSSMLQISQRSYSSLENGQTKLTIDRLFEILKILDVSFYQIFECDSCENMKRELAQLKNSIDPNSESYIEQKILYERIIQSKNTEIEFLKSLLENKTLH